MSLEQKKEIPTQNPAEEIKHFLGHRIPGSVVITAFNDSVRWRMAHTEKLYTTFQLKLVRSNKLFPQTPGIDYKHKQELQSQLRQAEIYEQNMDEKLTERNLTIPGYSSATTVSEELLQQLEAEALSKSQMDKYNWSPRALKIRMDAQDQAMELLYNAISIPEKITLSQWVNGLLKQLSIRTRFQKLVSGKNLKFRLGGGNSDLPK